jgi:mannosyltransferase
MKIIYDNIIYSLQHNGGISVVWSNLIYRMLNYNKNIRFIEYKDCVNNLSRKKIKIPLSLIDLNPAGFMCVKRYFNIHIKSKEKFIFHSSYFRTCTNKNAINITTVHDFTYEYFVQNPLKRRVHSYQKFKAIRNSNYIVCISENTKRDLLKFIPNIDPNKIFVIYNGISDDFYKIDTNNNSYEDYVLFVGNRNGYKNFDKVIEPVGIVKKPIYIVGKELSPSEKSLLKKYSCKYKYLGFVDDHQLNLLYNKAYCLLYPSSYEGFGLPVIEAQRAGCPVIAYNGSSISEICHDKTMLIDEITTKTILEKLNLISDNNVRNKIINAGLKNASIYTWDRTMIKYLELYKLASDPCPKDIY